MKRKNYKKLLIILSILIPGIFALISPLGLSRHQALTTAVLLITISWWSANLVKKIPASLFLLCAFAILQSAPIKTIFSFPLSENFYLIIITYLFSQGIANSGLIDIFLYPILKKYATTPVKIILCMVVVFYLTIYIIPQPIARLILIASVFKVYFDKTDMSENTRHALMFICFSLFALVNMGMRDSDLILNTSTVGFANVSFSNSVWIKYMFVPTAGYLVLATLLSITVFRKELLGVRFKITDTPKLGCLTSVQKKTGIIILLTVAGWLCSSLLNVSVTIITLVTTILFAMVGVLKKQDIKAIDITTMVFLTAAFSIGGVMKACGAAAVLFGQLGNLFPSEASLLYIFILVTVGIAVHMILGSNTTTLSVIVPGFIMMSSKYYPPEIVMLLAFICVAYHAILPFHCVTIAIGTGNHYFPAKYIARYGIPGILLIYIAVFLLYLPWWKMLGLLGGQGI